MNKKELKEAVDNLLSLEGKEQKEALEVLLISNADANNLLEALKTAHDKEAEELNAKIVELQSQLDSAKANPEELKRCQSTFKVRGKEYQFKVGYLKFRFQGRVVESEEAAKDKALREELVKIGFGGIEEVPAK